MEEPDTERIVIHHLAEVVEMELDDIHESHAIVEDLGADTDDLSFLFIPSVEDALRVKLTPQEWSRVHTVRDAIDALRNARERSL